MLAVKGPASIAQRNPLYAGDEEYQGGDLVLKPMADDTKSPK